MTEEVAQTIPPCLSRWIRQRTFKSLAPPIATSKFNEGWNLHRRGFPITALVSIEAKRGWHERDAQERPQW